MKFRNTITSIVVILCKKLPVIRKTLIIVPFLIGEKKHTCAFYFTCVQFYLLIFFRRWIKHFSVDWLQTSMLYCPTREEINRSSWGWKIKIKLTYVGFEVTYFPRLYIFCECILTIAKHGIAI